MYNLNRIQILGNVSGDPITKTVGNSQVATFSVATNHEYGEDKKITEWHSIVAWWPLSKICDQFVRKGLQVYMEGRNQTRTWEKDGQKMSKTEIALTDIKIFQEKRDTQWGGYVERREVKESNFDDLDIPF